MFSELNAVAERSAVALWPSRTELAFVACLTATAALAWASRRRVLVLAGAAPAAAIVCLNTSWSTGFIWPSVTQLVCVAALFVLAGGDVRPSRRWLWPVGLIAAAPLLADLPVVHAPVPWPYLLVPAVLVVCIAWIGVDARPAIAVAVFLFLYSLAVFGVDSRRPGARVLPGGPRRGRQHGAVAAAPSVGARRWSGCHGSLTGACRSAVAQPDGRDGMSPLERRCRLLLRAYPAAYRRDRGEEILGTLLEVDTGGAGLAAGAGCPFARDSRAAGAGRAEQPSDDRRECAHRRAHRRCRVSGSRRRRVPEHGCPVGARLSRSDPAVPG